MQNTKIPTNLFKALNQHKKQKISQSKSKTPDTKKKHDHQFQPNNKNCLSCLFVFRNN